MSRRSAAKSNAGSGSWWRLIARFAAVERDRLAVAVIAAGVVLAIGSVLLGGFVGYGRVFVAVLYSLAVLFPLVGTLIVIGVCWWLLYAAWPSEPPLIEGDPPEAGGTRASVPVTHETSRTLDAAAVEWYRCRDEGRTDAVVDRLVDGAVRALETTRGLDSRAAREAVRSGTWTDDRVAAAFLADDLRQPQSERLRAAVDPGRAFERRVRRTLAAIDDLEDDPRRFDPRPSRERRDSAETAPTRKTEVSERRE